MVQILREQARQQKIEMTIKEFVREEGKE